MEESLRRVEKLVHTTNSALAQMKFSLMFDDASGGQRAEGVDQRLGLDGEELRQCQDEFKSEANEMLAKMEKLFKPSDSNRKNSKALDRIKEINRKMNTFRQEQGKLGETDQSRQKLLSLIANSKFSPEVPPSKELVPARPAAPCRKEKELPEKHHRTLKKTDSRLSIALSPIKSKEELRNKILETQEIVDRGFYTARHLARKMENMTKNDRKEKAASVEKTVSDINLKSLEGRSDSSETLKTVKCEQYSKKEERKNCEPVWDSDRVNARMIDIKRKELQKIKRSNLRLQRLPSLHIRGGLQLQKIHNLEIPAGGDPTCGKPNTAVHILTHDQIEKEKMKMILARVKKENCCCSEDPEDTAGNYVECSNCGKIMRIQERYVDPKKVDDILLKCNFNVFDPRIDEFVEKYGAIDAAKYEKIEPPGRARPPEPEMISHELEKETETKKTADHPREIRYFSLEDFSNRLWNKYKEEAEALEGSHLKVDSLLRTLLRKIDESREAFEGCHLLKDHKTDSEAIPNLTATKPVLVTLAGDSLRTSRKRQKKLDKKDVKNRSKSRTEPLIKKEEGFSVSRSPTKSPEADLRVGRKLLPDKFSQKGNLRPMTAFSPSCKRAKNPLEFRKEATEENRQSPTMSSSSSRSWSDNQPEVIGNIRNVRLSSQDKVTEPAVGVFLMRETGKKSHVTSSDRMNSSVQSWKPRDEEKAQSAASSFSSTSSRSFRKQNHCRANVFEGEVKTNVLESSFEREEPEETKITMPLNKSMDVENEGKAPSEASSEKSENNYESDFEPENGGAEYEDEDHEDVLCGNKLSTISEVDSELEKKLTDEQKTLKSSLNSEALFDKVRPSEEGDVVLKQYQSSVDILKEKKNGSLTSEMSNKSQKVEDTHSKIAEASVKSTPTELVTSLKDILFALKDQFARTETLAEKLTENVKQSKEENPAEVSTREFVPLREDLWEMPGADKLVENLRSARRDPSSMPKPLACEKTKSAEDELSVESPSGEGGSSLGEVIPRKSERICGKSGSSSRSDSLVWVSQKEVEIGSELKVNVNREENCYSEGEIPSEVLLDSECCSSHSVGEVPG